MSNRNRYTKRQEQRINLDNQIRSKCCQKRSPTEHEIEVLTESIRKKRVADFALCKIYNLDLDVLVQNAGYSGTLFELAVDQKRDKIAMCLLRAGASPFVSHNSSTKANEGPHTKVPISAEPAIMCYYVWLTRLWRSADTGRCGHCSLCQASDRAIATIAPCGHSICGGCFWAKYEHLDALTWWETDGSDGEAVVGRLLAECTCCVICGESSSLAENSQPVKYHKDSSLERFMALPEVFSEGARGPKQVFDKALHLSQIARTNLGATRAQRSEELRKACAADDCRRIAALVEAGVDIERRDEYGMTPLHLAAWLGHARSVWLLLRVGADASSRVPQGYTVGDIAHALGHGNVLRALGAQAPATEAQHKLLSYRALAENVSVVTPGAMDGLHSAYEPSYAQRSGLTNPAVAILIPPEAWVDSQVWSTAGVKGSEQGAFCVDHCFPAELLSDLQEVFAQLPVALEEKERCAARSYFCDVTGRFTSTLKQAIRSATCALQRHYSTEQHHVDPVVFPELRFLHYQRDGSSLKAHVDLARQDLRTVPTVCDRARIVATSTHTLILYLTDCPVGGETVLLRALPNCQIRSGEGSVDAAARIAPRRGRLLIFPHNCPHEALAIHGEHPKLLLRGEVYLPL